MGRQTWMKSIHSTHISQGSMFPLEWAVLTWLGGRSWGGPAAQQDTGAHSTSETFSTWISNLDMCRRMLAWSHNSKGA